MVLIAAVFTVNMKIVRDTIMNIPLKNLLQRFRKHIHKHNAQIFKK